ncbi:MAG: glycosyltransferase family 2 protein [Candidatus Roizmanbacteria bacterium]|nr:MAG: glycosyltransferase family 2 protein [Candidatus Roizmanbacteria bacterium]
MSERFIKSNFFNRIGESAVPFLTWVIITFPLWFSPFHPAIVAYFIILFDLYFLYKSLLTAYYATVSYLKIIQHEKIPYFKKIANNKKSQEIQHFIIIPNYKEPLNKIESTIESIVKNDYPYQNLFLIMAFEKREEEAIEKANYFQAKYQSKFKDIITSYHILETNEEPGKASNQTFAARAVDEYVQKNNFPEKNVLITICDADSLLPKNYFSYVTYEYLKDKEGAYHFYWAPVLLYNNFAKLPFFVRMQATLSSLLRLAFLSQTNSLIQISTYTTNLWLLKQIDFWDVDIIPEDWHVFFQAFFTFGEKIKTIPLYTIINGDAVYSGSLLKTLKNRYEQEKRWAWGVSDMGYAWRKLFTTPHIPLLPKLKRIIFLAETHLLWPTSFFILTISASVPPLINPVFKRTVLGFLLPNLSGLILTIASAMLVLYIYLDIQLRKKVDIKTRPINVPFLLIQWYLLPVISFALSSLPALEAHTRLLLGKKITYKVTEKV